MPRKGALFFCVLSCTENRLEQKSQFMDRELETNYVRHSYKDRNIFFLKKLQVIPSGIINSLIVFL